MAKRAPSAGMYRMLSGQAGPDYAEMATVVVEMVYNRPRKQFTAEHHRAVNVILKRWAEARQAA